MQLSATASHVKHSSCESALRGQYRKVPLNFSMFEVDLNLFLRRRLMPSLRT